MGKLGQKLWGTSTLLQCFRFSRERTKEALLTALHTYNTFTAGSQKLILIQGKTSWPGANKSSKATSKFCNHPS